MSEIAQLVASLRKMGCSVCCIPPEGLEGVDPIEVESRLDRAAKYVVAELGASGPTLPSHWVKLPQ